MHSRTCVLAGLLLTGLVTGLAVAGDVQVTVSDGKQATANAVVYLLPENGEPTPAQDPAGVMDQQSAQFVPHVLAVRKGASVKFPNSDNIRHHVYSFSPAKPFQLRLYAGTSAEPVEFNHTGPVVLGCNIHDWMLGYIYIVDTPWYAKTGTDGRVTLENIPAGKYTLFVWHPRLPDINKPVSQVIVITENTVLEKQIDLALKPPVINDRNPPTDRSRNSLRDLRRGGS